MSAKINAGSKILDGLRDALSGNFAAITIEGQHWVRAPEWQPIETAPRDGTAIWVLLNNWPYIGYCNPPDPLFNRDERWFVKSSFRRRRRVEKLPDEIYLISDHDIHPTHWMPLPEPPVQS